MIDCKSCGGALEYSPTHSCLVCVKCDTHYEINKDTHVPKSSFDITQVETSNISIPTVLRTHCSSCGAVFEGSNLTIANVCQYCGSPLVEDLKDNSWSGVDGCIPFAFDKLKAKEYFEQGLRKKRFVPNKLKKNLPSNIIESIYIPAYLYDISTENSYFGQLYDNEQNSRGETYRDYRKIRGVNNSRDADILIECSNKLNQIQLDNVRPFDLTGIYKYSPDFLLGYSVEYFDKQLEETKKNLKEIVYYRVRNRVLSAYTYDGVDYLNIDTTYKACYYSKILLPTYCVKFKYNKKEYKTFLNGQTGKLGGNIPRSGWKIALLALSIASLVGTALYFIFA